MASAAKRFDLPATQLFPRSLAFRSPRHAHPEAVVLATHTSRPLRHAHCFERQGIGGLRLVYQSVIAGDVRDREALKLLLASVALGVRDVRNGGGSQRSRW